MDSGILAMRTHKTLYLAALLFLFPGVCGRAQPPIIGFWQDRSCTVTRTSCAAHLAAGCTTSGTFSVNPLGTAFNAYCDMTTSGGGWMIVSAVDTLSAGYTAGTANAGTPGTVPWNTNITGVSYSNVILKYNGS